jgi:rhomboid family GlyGly-CTERM serine protease
MNRLYLTPSLLLSLALALFMLMLSALPANVFDALSLSRSAVSEGELWRIFTGNLVHFGWAHTLMNAAAFLLCTFALLAQQSLLKFTLLWLWCCIAVGLGVFYLNPEYSTYAGLSGAIHGFIVVGLAQSRQHPLWLRIGALLLVAGKIMQEQSPDYTATDLQTLLPVPVATDAHLYGAIAGVVFLALEYGYHNLKRKP